MPWMNSLESFCCALSSLFPKVFCTFILTWSLYALIHEGCYNNIYISEKHPLLAVICSVIGFGLYGLCIYTYYKIIIVGPGSPNNFHELKIRNLRSLSTGNEDRSMISSSSGGGHKVNSANPYDSILDTSSTANTSTSLLSQAEALGDDTTAASLEEPEEPPSLYMKIHTLKNDSQYRYCPKCLVWKPDRCHHCSTCNQCILRMDHHCPWFACCIGFHNQKFFIQFLSYVTIYSLFAGFVSFLLLYKFFAYEEYENDYLSLQLIFLFILGVTFFLSVGCFGGFLAYLVLKNTTTIEFQENRWNYRNKNGGSFRYEFDNQGKKKELGNIFDLGTKRNMESIMGTTWASWLLPVIVTSNSIYDANNGLNYEINQEIYDKYCYNANLQEQLNQQLADYKKRVRMERELYSATEQV